MPPVISHGGKHTVHRTFLKKGVPFIEHLANLERVKKREFTLIIALPIKIKGATGRPRAPWPSWTRLRQITTGVTGVRSLIY